MFETILEEMYFIFFSLNGCDAPSNIDDDDVKVEKIGCAAEEIEWESYSKSLQRALTARLKIIGPGDPSGGAIETTVNFGIPTQQQTEQLPFEWPTAIYTFTAIDKEGDVVLGGKGTQDLQWSIGNCNTNLFTIDQTSGELSFHNSSKIFWLSRQAQKKFVYNVFIKARWLKEVRGISGHGMTVVNVMQKVTIKLGVPPKIESGPTGYPIVENSGAGQEVYQIIEEGHGDISFAIGGDDKDFLTVDKLVGFVTLNANPNYEEKSSYSFTVIATNDFGTDTKNVTFNIIQPTVAEAAQEGITVEQYNNAMENIRTITYNASTYKIDGSDSSIYLKKGDVYKFQLDISANKGFRIVTTDLPDGLDMRAVSAPENLVLEGISVRNQDLTGYMNLHYFIEQGLVESGDILEYSIHSGTKILTYKVPQDIVGSHFIIGPWIDDKFSWVDGASILRIGYVD